MSEIEPYRNSTAFKATQFFSMFTLMWYTLKLYRGLVVKLQNIYKYKTEERKANLYPSQRLEWVVWRLALWCSASSPSQGLTQPCTFIVQRPSLQASGNIIIRILFTFFSTKLWNVVLIGGFFRVFVYKTFGFPIVFDVLYKWNKKQRVKSWKKRSGEGLGI